MTSDKKAKKAARRAAAEAGRSYTAARRLDPLLQVTDPRPLEVNPQINWDHLTSALFDQIVEQLLYRIYDHTPGAKIEPMNGRGGDGGRDFVVKQGARLRIFQFKYFRDGFPAEPRSRRRQITQSFQQAMQHKPYEWTLVIPTVPTPGEREFVKQLGADYPKLKIRIIGRTELTDYLAANPDLVAFFTGDQARETARIFGREQAILDGGLPDLTDRVYGLSRVADTLDPNWGIDISVAGDKVRHTLRAKHRHAAARSPIRLDIRGTFGPEHEPLARAFRRSFGFGVPEPITLPPAVVEELTITGPAWLAGSQRGVEVTWTPVRQLPKDPVSVRLRMIDSDGNTTSSHQAKVLHAGSGSLGYSLEMDFYGLATVLLLLSSSHAELTGQFAFTQAMPPLVRQTVQLARDLEQCAAVEVVLDGVLVGRFTYASHRIDEQTAKDLALTEMLAEDLAIVQHHCQTYFPVPEDLTVDDRIAVRVARLLVEGHCVLYPQAHVLTATLNGRSDEGMRAMFADDGPASIAVDCDLTIEVAGQQLSVGQAKLFHTEVEIRDKARLLTELTAGRAAGLTMEWAPINGQSFRVFLPEARAGRDDEPLQVTGWGLPGLDGPARG